MIMAARSRSSVALLITLSLLVVFFSHGSSGRKMVAEAFEDDVLSTVPFEETEGESREMISLDYLINPGPNTNSKSGFLINPPSSSSHVVSPIAPSPH